MLKLCTYSKCFIPFRRNEEQQRKVQERQALLLKKKEAQKMQIQLKITATDVPEQIKTKMMEKLPQPELIKYGDPKKKAKEDIYSATWDSDEEHYWEEEKRKRDNCTSYKDYNSYIEKEMEEAKLAKTRMCSIDKLPTISDQGLTSKPFVYNNIRSLSKVSRTAFSIITLHVAHDFVISPINNHLEITM